MPGLVAGDLHVPGNGQHGGIAHMLRVVDAVFIPSVLNLSAEADLLRLIQLGDEPGVPQT